MSQTQNPLFIWTAHVHIDAKKFPSLLHTYSGHQWRSKRKKFNEEARHARKIRYVGVPNIVPYIRTLTQNHVDVGRKGGKERERKKGEFSLPSSSA